MPRHHLFPQVVPLEAACGIYTKGNARATFSIPFLSVTISRRAECGPMYHGLGIDAVRGTCALGRTRVSMLLRAGTNPSSRRRAVVGVHGDADGNARVERQLTPLLLSSFRREYPPPLQDGKYRNHQHSRQQIAHANQERRAGRYRDGHADGTGK